MSDTRDLTPGDRRELRSLVKKQFQVLRNDVKRREQELKAEIEAELARRYAQQDADVAEAMRAVDRAKNDLLLAMEKIADDLRQLHPELTVQAGRKYGEYSIAVHDKNRSQTHSALIASIPQQIAEASTQLDQDELELLRDLTIGALSSDQATQFLGRIPTVGALVPKARLAAIEGGAS